MAILTIREDDEVIQDTQEILDFLFQFGIWFRDFEGLNEVGEDASEEEILAAYTAPLRKLMKAGGYVISDIVNITPELENIETTLNKFNKEHWHSEDEIRLIVKGSGLFHLHPQNGPVFSVEIFKGDMLRIPQGMFHWFHLSGERTMSAIRLFKEKEGWIPHYTNSHKEDSFEPLFLGPNYTNTDVPEEEYKDLLKKA